MTDTAKRLIEAILKFKSAFIFPDHGGANVNLEAIIKNFSFVETGYLQDSGSVKCDYGYLITLIDKAIKSRNGSILIDIIKEAGKNVNISPQYLMEQFIELFSDAGLQLFESEGKLFDVPSKYRTGEGCSSGEEAIEKAVGCLKDIQLGTMTHTTLKRKAKIVYNIFHVYAHLQTEILTKALGESWVENFKGKDFTAFKEAIDNSTIGARVLAMTNKYTREEPPYIYFQGTAHLTGPCAVHSSTDPDEEIELLKTIMLDTSIKGNEAFTKAITFIHRSIFQKEIYTFLTGEFEENETHWTVDARRRSDFVHNLVGRYMEQHRKPYPPEAEGKPYIHFGGTIHLNGPQTTHGKSVDEELELLKEIMLDTTIRKQDAFVKALSFIHRSDFQEAIYKFLGTPFDPASHYWRVDGRTRGDYTFDMVDRYMEKHRKPNPPLSRYNMQDRDLKPTQSKEETMSTQQEIFKTLSGTRSLKEIIEFLKNAKLEDIAQVQKVCGPDVAAQSRLMLSMMEDYFGKENLCEGLAECVKQASQPGAPKIQISGPDGDMLSQLKEMFGDDCVIVPISQGDNISEVLANVMKEQQPVPTKAQVIRTEIDKGLDTLVAQWAQHLNVTNPEVIKYLREAAAKKIELDTREAEPNTTEMRHTRTMEFEVLGVDNEVEIRYRGVWNESTKVIAVSCSHTGSRPGFYQYLFHAQFTDYSDAVSTFTGIRDNYGVKEVIDIARDFVNAYNGRFVEYQK